MKINIKDTLLAGERVTLECKKATNGVPSSLWDTYSAFANTYGGTILLAWLSIWMSKTMPNGLI